MSSILENCACEVSQVSRDVGQRPDGVRELRVDHDPVWLQPDQPLNPAENRMIHIYPGALAISALFSTHGYRKGSLDASGYAAAFVVGYLSLANDLKC